MFSQTCDPIASLKVKRVHYIMKCERIYVPISAMTVTNLPESTSSCRGYFKTTAGPLVAVVASFLMPTVDATKVNE